MPKILSIIRHAKSIADLSGPDRARALNERGRSDAKLIGKFLSAQGVEFDQVYCSTAIRARQTFAKINELLKLHDDQIQFEDSLYLASLAELLSFIENLPADQQRVALVGHNPGLTELCNTLGADELGNLPTCGVFTVRFPTDDWREAGAGAGESQKIVTPRMLKEVLSQL